MKCTSINEWHIGDKAKTKYGEIVTVIEVSDRFVKIGENLERKLYIPAHGEIEKIN